MEHVDPTDSSRSWTIRFGTGGNIYSLFSPDGYGEAMPPQARSFAPFVDELHQTVVVAQHLNTPSHPFFIHQAGIYTKDSPYTDQSFFSPNVARHCVNNTCSFISWGQQAHVPTEYPSPALILNRYTNCGNGIIMYTHAIQNIAPKGANYQRFTYLNVPWTGIRESTLPDVITPDPTTSTLTIDPANGDVRTQIYGWGEPEELASATTLRPGTTAGYTTFASGVWPNKTAIQMDLPCIKPNSDCTNGALPQDPDNCMVSNCSDAQIAAEGYERMVFQVPSTGTHCQRRLHSTASRRNNLLLRCRLRTKIEYGKQYGTDIGDYILMNSTGSGIRINQIYHFSWAMDQYVYLFVTDYLDDDSWHEGEHNLKEQIEATFLPGENITFTTYTMPQPEAYNSSILPSLTYIYGKGEEYESSDLGGQGRIRMGATHRDCKILVSVLSVLCFHAHCRLQHSSNLQPLAQFLIASPYFSRKFTTRRRCCQERPSSPDSSSFQARWVMLNPLQHRSSIHHLTRHSWIRCPGTKWTVRDPFKFIQARAMPRESLVWPRPTK